MFIFTTRFVNEVEKGAAMTENWDMPVDAPVNFLVLFLLG